MSPPVPVFDHSYRGNSGQKDCRFETLPSGVIHEPEAAPRDLASPGRCNSAGCGYGTGLHYADSSAEVVVRVVASEIDRGRAGRKQWLPPAGVTRSDSERLVVACSIRVEWQHAIAEQLEQAVEWRASICSCA